MAITDDKVRFFGPATLAANENKDPFGAGGTFQSSTSVPTDPFWDVAYSSELKNRWDKVYPYQLLILERVNGSYSNANIKARFTLPIPPQELNIDMPFAIETTVTMGGVIEEHNGAPLRTITLSGTTGLLPLRGTVVKPGILSQATTIFAGTFSGVNTITNSFNQAGNVLGFDGVTPPNVIPETDFDGDLGNSTGFYQFMLLQRFLESYITQKKTNEGRNLRLAFAIWKEQEVYIVSPVLFSRRRSAASPMEYMYTLQLRAWRRITLDDNQTQPYNNSVGIRDINKLAQIANAIDTGRKILEGVRNTLQGVRADIQNILFTPLRETGLFVKDMIGTSLVATDMPSNIMQDFREGILELVTQGQGIDQLSRSFSRVPQTYEQTVSDIQEAFRDLAISSGKADTGAGQDPASKQAGLFGGTQNAKNADRANKIAANPLDNFSFFNTIRISDLNLRPATIKKIEDERTRVRNYRREDFEKFRDQTLTVLADFSDFVGAGNSTYTKLYGLPTRTTTRTPTDDEWDTIHSLSQLAQTYDTLAASTTINQDVIDDIEYVAGLATRSGIAFRVPKSKFAVPFPYGYTLEQLADRYLGDPLRWHEIATLNGLQAPYVDETGFQLPLLVNGSGNDIVISDASNIFVGQLLWLSSSNVRRESRRVQRVVQTGSGQFVVTLDGDSDLVKFTTVGASIVQGFLPNTVNSQMQIYIPSDIEPPEEDFRVKSIPGVDYFDPLVRTGGVDLLLTQSGDLVITPDGDSRLAVGLTNLIQKVRLALATPRGSLMHHPDYGIGIKPGTSTADISANDLLNSADQMFKDDPGFTGVQSASVRKDTNAVYMKIVVGIAGGTMYIPVEVQAKQ